MSITPLADRVALIHGLWMTPRSWEHWIESHFTALAAAGA